MQRIELEDRLSMVDAPDFQSRGARVSVLLHEEQLWRFFEVWRRAKSSGADLPVVDDPDYASLEALLGHVLRWARAYLIWICDQLDLPAPAIGPAPDVPADEDDVIDYMTRLLAAWRNPLRSVTETRFSDRTYTAPWGVLYSIDAMLEHAVMHPIKHRFQLEALMGER